MTLSHEPVLVQKILDLLPEAQEGSVLDATAGGGGHFNSILKKKATWKGECWDQDPLAKERLRICFEQNHLDSRATFVSKNFREAPSDPSQHFDFILADLGVSSFQIDDRTRGMSLLSEAPVDFRMNPSEGESFSVWLEHQSEENLADIFYQYGEEPKSRRLSKALKNWDASLFSNAKLFASEIASTLAYNTRSRIHPATRAFQALRIAINQELEALEAFLTWAPQQLTNKGRLAIISFHSLEDRIVKHRFRDLAQEEEFDILFKKPVIPDDEEMQNNPRSRSAKLRVLERKYER